MVPIVFVVIRPCAGFANCKIFHSLLSISQPLESYLSSKECASTKRREIYMLFQHINMVRYHIIGRSPRDFSHRRHAERSHRRRHRRHGHGQPTRSHTHTHTYTPIDQQLHHVDHTVRRSCDAFRFNSNSITYQSVCSELPLLPLFCDVGRAFCACAETHAKHVSLQHTLGRGQRVVRFVSQFRPNQINTGWAHSNIFIGCFGYNSTTLAAAEPYVCDDSASERATVLCSQIIRIRSFLGICLNILLTEKFIQWVSCTSYTMKLYLLLAAISCTFTVNTSVLQWNWVCNYYKRIITNLYIFSIANPVHIVPSKLCHSGSREVHRSALPMLAGHLQSSRVYHIVKHNS